MQQVVKSVTVLVLLALASPSFAQTSPTALGRDSEDVLVNKNVGAQQWAISRSFATRNVSGNVFEPGVEPRFVFCEQQAILNDVLQLVCFGAVQCADSPCANDWEAIAEVGLPASFFDVGPDGEPGLEGLVGSWRFYDYAPATLRERITLESIEDRDGTPTLVGEDAGGHEVIVQRFADAFPGPPGVYEFAGALDDGSSCRFYTFNRSGDGLRGRLQVTPSGPGGCGAVVVTYEFEAARLGHAMMIPLRHADDEATTRALDAVRAALTRTLVERLP